MSVFETLRKVDVSQFTEQKGQFTYLSWADAVNELLNYYPEATWQVRHNHDGWPYFPCPAGAFVEVELTIEGVTRLQVHPVLDHKNKPISEPDSFQVNTAIQRCLAKAISLHGLGLYIYRGEDLPDVQHRFKPGEKEEITKQVKDALFNGDEVGLKQVLDEYSQPEEKMAVWALFTSKERDSIKKMLNDSAVTA